MEHKKGEHHMGFYLGDVRLWRFLFLPFHGTFSRHGIDQASSSLLIWLNDNVHFNPHRSLDRFGLKGLEG